MKRFLTMCALLCAGLMSFGQNYELAEHFTAKKVKAMVGSTKVIPYWFRDSDKFWYYWKASDGDHYYIVDPLTGKRSEVFDREALAMELTGIVGDPYDAQHLPVAGMELKDDKTFTFSVTSTQEEKDSVRVKDYGELKRFTFSYDIASRKLTDITGQEEKDEYPRFASVSPDGEIGVYCKGGNLFVMDKENLAKAAKDDKDSTLVEKRITEGCTGAFGFHDEQYGRAETDSTKRHYPSDIVWAPDSKHFAAVKTDSRKIKPLWVINSLSEPRPKLEAFNYQMPGEPGATAHLFVFNTESFEGKEVKVSAFKDQTLWCERAPEENVENYAKFSTAKWLGTKDGFWIGRQSRDQKRIDYCHVQVGADSALVVVEERMNTYVENRSLRLIDGGKSLLFWSERNGWANLYLTDLQGGNLKNLTPRAFHVEDVLAVNDKERFILFNASGYDSSENPYQIHTFRVGFDGTGLKKIDIDDMDAWAQASEDGKWFVCNYSRVDAAPASSLYDATGRKVLDLEKADLSMLYASGYKLPERFKVKAADGITDLYGAMYKPFDFDSTKTYPIIEYVYPGPQVEANNISWVGPGLRLDRLAQIGFIVITVGNRGGHPMRSKWYHNYGYGNLRDYGLEDQKFAVQQLAARYPWIDGTKVGIHGHSGGGFMSTAAILKYPDFYTAAVSCAGNHDNRIYNRWWSEQHHGVKENVSEKGDTTFAYSITTNPEIASNLKGHLMLVHGDVDDNVNPANTYRVVNALIRANKRFDLLILPGQRHGFGDMNEYFFYRLADYFSEWLLGSSHRSEVDIKELNND